MAADKPRLSFHIDPTVRNRIKAQASLEGQTVREWCTNTLELRLQNGPTVQFSAVGTKRKVRTG